MTTRCPRARVQKIIEAAEHEKTAPATKWPSLEEDHRTSLPGPKDVVRQAPFGRGGWRREETS